MITEQDIARRLGRPMASPVRLGSLDELGLNAHEFVAFVKPVFEQLTDDGYLQRLGQLNFLKAALPASSKEIDAVWPDYYSGVRPAAVLAPLVAQLNGAQREAYAAASLVTRRRSLATFCLERKGEAWKVSRLVSPGFRQNVPDGRSVTRVFAEAPEDLLAAERFLSVLRAYADLVRSIELRVQKLTLTAHFMRSLPQREVVAENSPEGVHEDGAAYIVSALVVERHNMQGAVSQVYERHADGRKELLLEYTLQPGEFLFQADTGEEHTFGNDLWHYVTPMARQDASEESWRDIVGFDIELGPE